MTESSYTNWNSMTDKAILAQIGKFIKHQRVAQNSTQDVLSKAAGISRSTLSLLERGETVTLPTLIQVMRVLNQLQFMEHFVLQEQISPLWLAKQEKYKRKRASKRK